MKLDGTSFQKLVWEEISKIPYGQTRSYKQIAINIGHPNSQEQSQMLVGVILIL